MATTSSISLTSLTYCLLIFFMCQINFPLTLGLYQYKKYHPNPFQQQQDGRLAYFDEYFRQNYPLNHEENFLLNDNNNKEIFKFNQQPISRLNGFKRDLRLNSQSNKRMLCFFHAVNCFG